jgi:hypothetical protein
MGEVFREAWDCEDTSAGADTIAVLRARISSSNERIEESKEVCAS